MARYHYWGIFKDQGGRLVANGTVTVYLAATPPITLANVFANSAGGAHINSVTSNASGYWEFWVDDTDYNFGQLFALILSKTNYQSQTYNNISIITLNTDVLYLSSYSPVGDGVTDDTTALTNAINAAAGKTLVISKPSVSYKISSSISLPNSCKIIGAGLPTIYQSTANTAIFIPGNDCEISFIKFTGTGNLNVAGRGAIYNDPNNGGLIGARVKIHDCTFDSSLSTSYIAGNNWIDCRIFNNTLNLGVQAEHGIYISGGSADTWITGNNISRTGVAAGTSLRGIQIKGSNRIYVENNNITGTFNGYGIISSDVSSQDIYIRENKVYSLASGADGISAGNNNTDTNIFIEDNEVTACVNGVHIVGATAINNIFVRRNTIINGTAKGIFFDGTGSVATNLVADDNICIGNTGDGINSTACSNPLFIRKNFITGSGASAGISIPSGSTQGVVEFNTSVGYNTPLNIITTIPQQLNQTSLTGLAVSRGAQLGLTAKTSAYTLLTSDTIVTGDATGGAFSFTLPAATGTGQIFTLKKIDSSANVITVARAGADTIDGLTSYPLLIQYNWLQLIDSASGKWSILSTNVKPSVLVSLSSDQSISATTSTKIQFATKEYDDNGDFDAVTNYRWSPKIPGKYRISIDFVGLQGGTAGNGDIAIFKNGSQYRGCTVNAQISVPFINTYTFDILVASGDYFEVFTEWANALTIKKLASTYYTTAIATTFSAMKID